MHVLAGFRKIPGPPPQRDRLEHGTVLLGPGVDRRPARHLEQRPAIVAGKDAESGWRIGRAEGGEADRGGHLSDRSEEHTSELQSLMRISYAVFCLKKKKKQNNRVIQVH